MPKQEMLPKFVSLWICCCVSGFFSSSMPFAVVVDAAPLEDMVETLPLIGKPPTTQFSGFLDGTAGCDTEQNGSYCKIHYWLTLSSQPNWQELPIVVWLNGGPGSSSILGYLTENGPLLINATGGFVPNPYAWTNLANLLILEAPVGVGFSYCERQVVDNVPCVNTDRYTASTSRAAIVDFFQNKFPEFQPNELYITGESYAGVYIPTLTRELLDIQDESIKTMLNLKGIAVGDPCTDNDAQNDSMDSLWYSNKYGLVDEEIFDILWNDCNTRIVNPLFASSTTTTTTSSTWKSKRTFNKDSNTVDNASTSSRILQDHDNDIDDNDDNDPFDWERLGGPDFKYNDPKCVLALRKYYWSTSNGLSQSWRKLYIDDYSLFGFATDQDDAYMGLYMNRRDVQKALHVTESPTTTTWPYAPQGFDYTKEYAACNWNEDAIVVPYSMIEIYREIVPQLQRTFIYNGDTDPCVSYEGTRLAVKQIGFDEVDGGSYRPWFYNHTAVPSVTLLQERSPMFGPNLVATDMGAQFGGEVVCYEHNLSFLTIHGSGHMVPQFRPQAALHMISKLLKNQSLSPLLPTNETLTNMSGDGFRTAMNAWTILAQSQQFIQ